MKATSLVNVTRGASACILLGAGCMAVDDDSADAPGIARLATYTSVSGIDVHTHLESSSCELTGTARTDAQKEAMSRAYDAASSLLMDYLVLMPQPGGNAALCVKECNDLVGLMQDAASDLATYPTANDWVNHFRFMCGGGDVELEIHDESETNVTPSQTEIDAFKLTAQQLVSPGTSIDHGTTHLGLGYGELALTHQICGDEYFKATTQYELSGVYYQRTELLEYQKALIEVAAQSFSPNLPIEVHMEWIPQEVVDNGCTLADRPTHVFSNLTHLKRFLTYAENVSGGPVNVVWDHIGRDSADQVSYGAANPEPAMLRELLREHPNLILQVVYSPQMTVMTEDNGTPYDTSDDTLKSDWYQLLSDEANRVVLGTDSFFESATTSYASFESTFKDAYANPAAVTAFLGQVPSVYRQCYQKLNAEYIYNLTTTAPTGCTPPAGRASLNSTATVRLGQMARGAALTRWRTITASNSGTPLPRSVEDVTVTGGFSYSGCSLKGTHMCNAVLFPGETCSVKITASYTDRNTCPLEVFSSTVTVEYYDGSAYQSLSIPVTGEFL